MSVGARGVFPRSLENSRGGGGGGGEYRGSGPKKRNKSVAKWEYASWCVLSPPPPPLADRVPRSPKSRPP